MTKKIVVLGGGFAGLWSAIGAARLRHELQCNEHDLRIVLIDRNDYHAIRVRNYEADLNDCIVPFDDVLPPVGVERIKAEVEDVDVAKKQVHLLREGKVEVLDYDRLVFTLGSRLQRPPIPGLAQHTFDVDTHAGARRLREHLQTRLADGSVQACKGVLIVGAGLTGVEVASELASEFRREGLDAAVTICDSNPRIGSDMGSQAAGVIEGALQELGVATRIGVRITAVDAEGVTLGDGQRIDVGTVIWCAGMSAHPLASCLNVPLDRLGRLPVDEFMRVKGVADVYAAGDAAWTLVDDLHTSVMSCQHGRPMGRYAGHNVAADVLGGGMLPLRIDWYVTVVDLGDWGAVYTEGWERNVVSVREAAKKTKQIINRERIYPPRSGSASEILAASAPVVQTAPKKMSDAPTC